MREIQEVNDIYKEVLTVLAYFDNNLISKIPNTVFTKLTELAADSKVDFYIDTTKSLNEQKISEESKDLISLIYYTYAANENEKKELLKFWNENENKYQKELREKYNSDKIFPDKILDNHNIEASNTALVKYKKENILDKIRNFIKNIFKITMK